MKTKKTIRQIVREEVAKAIHEVITELKQPTQSQPQPKKIVEKKSYTNNSVLNEVLNETAASEDWKTMGGGVYDSNRAGDVLSSQYGDLMTDKPSGEQMVASMGVDPNKVDNSVKDALTKDYSALMQKMNKQPRGKIQK
tara:strand:- start:104 stop:520 length:417 start_codon:yes stop_codon:yes gene_type:complete